jgi:acyl-CoA thioesterase
VDEGQWKDRPARDPVWQEWYRFRPRARFDDPWVDAGRAVLLIDTLTWPAACNPHPDSAYIAPNLDLSVWFHASDPGSEWLLADHVSPIATGGLVCGRGQVWSESRQLLASGAAQLLCSPAPTP